MKKLQWFVFALITFFLFALAVPAFSCNDESESCPMMERAIKEGKPLPPCCLKHKQEKDEKEDGVLFPKSKKEAL